MYRLRLVVPVFAVVLLTSSFLLGEDKKTEKEPIIVTVKLPYGYSKLGLSTKQRKAILKTRGEYAAKIEELKRQIDELKEKEASDLEKYLTEAQKTRLREVTGSRTGKNNEIKDKPAEDKKK